MHISSVWAGSLGIQNMLAMEVPAEFHQATNNGRAVQKQPAASTPWVGETLSVVLPCAYVPLLHPSWIPNKGGPVSAGTPRKASMLRRLWNLHLGSDCSWDIRANTSDFVQWFPILLIDLRGQLLSIARSTEHFCNQVWSHTAKVRLREIIVVDDAWPQYLCSPRGTTDAYLHRA